MKGIITVILVLIFIGNCNGYFHKHDESIFVREDIKSYCDMKCGDRHHTLCVGKSIPKCADNFLIYDDIEDDLIMAINGLRDRIAYKMQVSNMARVAWDHELSTMAKNFLKYCDPFLKDHCADLGATDEKARETEPRYYHVSGTVGFRRNKFKPYDLVSSIVRDWYYGKNNINPPEIRETDYGDSYGVLVGHNNFTHLADPRLIRVGCGLARFRKGYGLVCYYFPYFQSDVTFYRGPPASNCPNRYPLKDIQFANLCTGQGVQWGPHHKLLVICTFVGLLNVFGVILTGTGCSGSACKGV